ncbi:MAG: ABC transporter permease subunit [Bacillota bacterium]|nr:ABC transporter permease subunit [Bacillota bacterium]
MSIYKAELKRLLKPFLVWTLTMLAINILFMSLYPSILNSGYGDLIKAKIDMLPDYLRKVFGVDMSMDFTDLLQYYGYTAQMLQIGACVFAAILGASALAKEESEGTIELLYAQPVTRTKIVSTKLFSTLSILIAFNVIITASSLIFLEALKSPGYEYLTQVLSFTYPMLLVQLAFWALGLGISSALSKQSIATPAATGLFFVTYILGTFSQLTPDTGWMKYLSPYHYAVPSSILQEGGKADALLMVLLAVYVFIGVGTAYSYYLRKNMKI